MGICQDAVDPTPVEGNRGLDIDSIRCCQVAEASSHAEAGDADLRCAVLPRQGHGDANIIESLFVFQGRKCILPVPVSGVETMIDVGGDRDVALAGQPFTHAKQLPTHAVALHHDDDARTRRATRASDEAGGRVFGLTHGDAPSIAEAPIAEPPISEHSGLLSIMGAGLLLRASGATNPRPDCPVLGSRSRAIVIGLGLESDGNLSRVMESSLGGPSESRWVGAGKRMIVIRADGRVQSVSEG